MRKVNLLKSDYSAVSEHIKLPLFYFFLAASFAGWQSFYNVHLDSIGYTSMPDWCIECNIHLNLRTGCALLGDARR